MANDWNYVPIFKDNILLMSELTNEEFGILVRSAMSGVSAEARPDGFSDLMYMSYKVLMSQVERVYREREARINAKRSRRLKGKDSGGVPMDKYQSGDISPDEALRIALERSFGDADTSDIP